MQKGYDERKERWDTVGPLLLQQLARSIKARVLIVRCPHDWKPNRRTSIPFYLILAQSPTPFSSLSFFLRLALAAETAFRSLPFNPIYIPTSLVVFFPPSPTSLSI